MQYKKNRQNKQRDDKKKHSVTIYLPLDKTVPKSFKNCTRNNVAKIVNIPYLSSSPEYGFIISAIGIIRIKVADTVLGAKG